MHEHDGWCGDERGHDGRSRPGRGSAGRGALCARRLRGAKRRGGDGQGMRARVGEGRGARGGGVQPWWQRRRMAALGAAQTGGAGGAEPREGGTRRWRQAVPLLDPDPIGGEGGYFAGEWGCRCVCSGGVYGMPGGSAHSGSGGQLGQSPGARGSSFFVSLFSFDLLTFLF